MVKDAEANKEADKYRLLMKKSRYFIHSTDKNLKEHDLKFDADKKAIEDASGY